MRRYLAIALAVIFGYTLIAPALALGGSSQLPACCRRDGKHHCSMIMETSGAESASRERQIDAPPLRCPLFPSATAPSHAVAFVPAHAASFAGTAPPSAIFSSIEAGRRVSAERGFRKRGPPPCLFS